MNRLARVKCLSILAVVLVGAVICRKSLAESNESGPIQTLLIAAMVRNPAAVLASKINGNIIVVNNLPSVIMPPAPAGTRDVLLNGGIGKGVGDFSTLRNLTLNGVLTPVAVPSGTYGVFKANGFCTFVLGVAGAQAPATYNLQGLSLNGSCKVVLAGPVILNVASKVVANGSSQFSAADTCLTLNVYRNALVLNGNSVFYGTVVAPSGTITINGFSNFYGLVESNRLLVNSSSLSATSGTCGQSGISSVPTILSAASAAPVSELVNLSVSASSSDGSTLTYLSFSLVALPVYFSRTRVEGRKKIESPRAFVLVFHPYRHARLCRQCRSQARSRLQTGLFIHAQNRFVRCQWASVQIADFMDDATERFVARRFGRQPQMFAPGFEPISPLNKGQKMWAIFVPRLVVADTIN